MAGLKKRPLAESLEVCQFYPTQAPFSRRSIMSHEESLISVTVESRRHCNKMIERGSEKPKPLLLFLFIACLIVGVSIIGFKKIMSKPSNETNEDKIVAYASEEKSIIANEKENDFILAANMQVTAEPVKEGNDEESDEDSDSDPDGDYEDDEDSIDEILDTPIKNNYTVSDGPFKMVLCMNMSLNMGKGKMCAQSGHATLGAYRIAEKHCSTAITWWHKMGQAKIAVKVENDVALFELQNKARMAGLVTYIVEDAGRTQIAAGSKTVLAIGPAPVQAFEEITKHLKLL